MINLAKIMARENFKKQRSIKRKERKMAYATEQSVLNAQFNSALEVNATEIAKRAPHVLMKPTLTRDGNQFCFLYGPNPMEGVVGYGDTAELAAENFDKAWKHLKYIKSEKTAIKVGIDSDTDVDIKAPNETYVSSLKDYDKQKQDTNKVNLAPGLKPNEELEAALKVIGKSTALSWAEGLIEQLSSLHDGRNSWLLNHGRKKEALEIQQRHANRK